MYALKVILVTVSISGIAMTRKVHYICLLIGALIISSVTAAATSSTPWADLFANAGGISGEHPAVIADVIMGGLGLCLLLFFVAAIQDNRAEARSLNHLEDIP